MGYSVIAHDERLLFKNLIFVVLKKNDETERAKLNNGIIVDFQKQVVNPFCFILAEVDEQFSRKLNFTKPNEAVRSKNKQNAESKYSLAVHLHFRAKSSKVEAERQN